MRIAVIVPLAYSGGTMRGALNAAVQIHDGAIAYGDDVRVEFGYVDHGQEAVHGGFRELRERHIPYRPVRVELKPAGLFPGSATRFETGHQYAIFNDGVSNFDDADFVLIISDRVIGGLVAPTYRYGMVVHDFIQRYVPAIFDGGDEGSSAASWKLHTALLRHFSNAEAIFVTTEQARRDAISFGGVPAHKVVSLPMEFDPLDTGSVLPCRSAGGRSQEGKRDRYIIWTTNTTQHKNHLVALEALLLRYEADASFPRVEITGAETHLLDLREKTNPLIGLPWIKKIRKTIEDRPILRKKLTVRGNLSDAEYLRLLGNAAFLFHPAIFDNGTFSVVEAAWMGVPSASSKYAAMSEISSRFDIPIVFFDWSDPVDIARGLAYTNENAEQLQQMLPERAALARFSRTALAPEYWAQIRGVALHGRSP